MVAIDNNPCILWFHYTYILWEVPQDYLIKEGSQRPGLQLFGMNIGQHQTEADDCCTVALRQSSPEDIGEGKFSQSASHWLVYRLVHLV